MASFERYDDGIDNGGGHEVTLARAAEMTRGDNATIDETIGICNRSINAVLTGYSVLSLYVDA